MKKTMMFVLAIAMAVTFCGTALAANSVELATATSGVSEVFWGPVFTSGPGGSSAYVLTGAPFATATTKPGETGTTLYAISGTANNAAGTEMFSRALKYLNGCTAIGGPQLISGTTHTVVVYAQAPYNQTVANQIVDTGATVFFVNGFTGADIKSIGLYSAGAGLALTGDLVSNFSSAPVTIDDENHGYSGATVFGVNGCIGSAVSVWGISAQTGTYSRTPAGQSNVTAFLAGGQVSAVRAAPVVSGNSLFIIGYDAVGNGNTIYQFDKNNIWAGPKASRLIDANNTLSDQWVPTPAVSGNSIFVVDNKGGVTSYRKDNLAKNYSVRYTTVPITTGVTAGPVVADHWIVLCSTSGVTCANINKLSNLSTTTRQWYYEFGAGKQIWATPVISNGYVWVTVNDTAVGSSTIYRFTLNSTTGNIQTVETFGEVTYADPAVVGGHIWTVSADPTVRKVPSGGADGYGYWPQFKFDKAKTGNNTAQHQPDAAPGSSGGCFISTVK